MEIDPDDLLKSWHKANEKDYQSGIANQPFLHDVSIELLCLIYSLDFSKLLELGTGCGRNVYYFNKFIPDREYLGNDLNKEKCFKFMKDDIKEKITFIEKDTLNFILDNKDLKPDLILDSDHLMHLHPDSVCQVLEKICTEWRPKYFITRYSSLERKNKMPYIWRHDYSIFNSYYSKKTIISKVKNNYVIDVYTRRMK